MLLLATEARLWRVSKRRWFPAVPGSVEVGCSHVAVIMVIEHKSNRECLTAATEAGIGAEEPMQIALQNLVVTVTTFHFAR